MTLKELGTKVAVNLLPGRIIMPVENACVTEKRLIENVDIMKKSFTELKIIGSEIQSIGSIMQKRPAPEWVEMDLVKGRGMYITIDKNEFCHVVSLFFHPGSEFPFHTHPGNPGSIESIFVYFGLCELMMKETGEKVKVGDGHRKGYMFDGLQEHSGYLPVATGMYGITMPPGYEG